MRPSWTLLLALAAGCRLQPGAPAYVDEDGDGWDTTTDCDDADPLVAPFADERCDGIDNDCDGEVDEDDAVDALALFVDGDGDGYGGHRATACAVRAGLAATGGDCDDADVSTYPGADERCDGADNDCDSDVDEDPVDTTAFFVDVDGDGFGAGPATLSCEAPLGMVAAGGDCADEDPSISPAADERCDKTDNDCDGEVDEEGAVDAPRWYRDEDGDGYGAGEPVGSCEERPGLVKLGGDCEPTWAEINPAVLEACNGYDDNCDGRIDYGDAVEGRTVLYYADADGDGYGADGSGLYWCAPAAALVTLEGDCDDEEPAVYVGAEEVCDHLDNDCDGEVDVEAIDERTWWFDADGDGYGAATSDARRGCDPPTVDWARFPDDCDDGDPAVSPGEAEVCGNDVDEDCDDERDNGCPITHCGTITASEVWGADHPHLVTCLTKVGGSAHPVLTVEDGAEVQFYPGAGLQIGDLSYGRLVVQGDVEGVRFTSLGDVATPGYWQGVTIGQQDEGSQLRGLTVAYADGTATGAVSLKSAAPLLRDLTVLDALGTGVYVDRGSEPEIDGLTVEGCGGDGLVLDPAAALARGITGPGVAGGSLSDNGGYPARLPAAYADEIGGSTVIAGNGVDLVELFGDTLVEDATWDALDVPWWISTTVSVGSSTGHPTLTLMDGAELRFAPGAGLSVGVSSAGRLVALGTGLGITLTSGAEVPAPGDWAGLTLGSADEGSELEGVTVAYAQGTNGAIYLNRSAPTLRDCQILDSLGVGLSVRNASAPQVSGCVITGSGGEGVSVDGTSSLAGRFRENAITGSGGAPLSLPAAALGAVEDSCSFAGNALQEVTVTSGTVTEDAVWSNLGVPLHLTGPVSVGSHEAPHLVLREGLELRFDGLAALKVGSSSAASLEVAGTGAHPVVFTASSGAPGGWPGLTLGRSCDAAHTVMEHAVVEYGGGNGRGNVYFDSCSATLRDSTVAWSSNWGVYRSSANPTLSNITYLDNALGDLK
ncbi:MAG: right-handed parallel beta-helix repeat-containing protein [Deltaproteobacteria bacterium]|nr:right-handed parallel beta-helix repeat-containing protein [Deltaproteobacteria bacterium]